MILLFVAHFIFSVVVAIGSDAAFPWSYFLGFFIMAVAAGGLKGTLIQKEKKMVIPQLVFGFGILALGIFIVSRSSFGVSIAGIGFSPVWWGLIGALFAFFGTSQRHAAPSNNTEETGSNQSSETTD